MTTSAPLPSPVRILDSVGVGTWRQPVRTIHAQEILDRPDLDSVYIKLGDGVLARYRRSALLSRLDTPPSPVLTFPYPTQTAAIQQRAGVLEHLLPVMSSVGDSIWNVDLAGWHLVGPDSDTRMTGFDVDARGNVIVACTVFSWGILDVTLRSVYQNPTDQASVVIAFRSGGRDYVLQSSGRLASIYDTTDLAHPKQVSAVRVPKVALNGFAKSTDTSRIGLIGFNNHLFSIYSSGGLLMGDDPLFSGGGATSVSTDGTSFYVLSGNVITILSPDDPDALGYHVANSFTVDAALNQPARVHYGDGRLYVRSSATPWAGLLYDLTGKQVEVDISASFSPEAVNAVDGVVIDGHLLVSNRTVLDSYRLQTVPVPPDPGPGPLPPSPDYSDQQTESHLFVIRQTEAEVKLMKADLTARKVSYCDYYQLPDKRWKFIWL